MGARRGKTWEERQSRVTLRSVPLHGSRALRYIMQQES